MKQKNYDEDIRFKVRQRYATISDWMSKTIDSERVPEVKARSQCNAAIKIQKPAIISLQAKSIDTVLNRKARLSVSQQASTLQSQKVYRKLIDPNLIIRSIDYSELGDSPTKTKKKNPFQNKRLNRQFQAIYNKMQLILDSYNSRERILLQYIAKLQKEIVILKQGHIQTI
ncbi:unnamed protein product [Paramecium sonneborni]|uniref:Uncharacterized protein n=1 Tax=Paramecium sonneborni TaxID=65129 RepID=A0A8S1Q6G2_9CILI|nr:unnamed protein product [Paramecium sonneborni]